MHEVAGDYGEFCAVAERAAMGYGLLLGLGFRNMNRSLVTLLKPVHKKFSFLSICIVFFIYLAKRTLFVYRHQSNYKCGYYRNRS